jgi:hypothetical protein
VPHGLSTGAWTVVYALDRHPEALVVIAGIGVAGGGHWNDAIEHPDHTAMKTRYLLPRLSEDDKARIMTTDDSFARYVGVTRWSGPEIA